MIIQGEIQIRSACYKVISKLEKQITIPISLSDNTAHLSTLGVLSLFMDMASEHGPMIGLGMEALAEKGLMWVVAKTKIRIFKRPKMLSEVTVSTWPETPGAIRCNRYHKMTAASEVLAEGKNEWTMIGVNTGKPHKIKEAYPEGLVHCEDIVCEGAFSRPNIDFSDCGEIAKYTVCSNDIDVSRHMNNVAYLRAVLGAFSCDKLEKMNISEIEITYRVQCYEGEELSIRMRETGDGYEFGVIKSSGETAAIVKLAAEKEIAGRAAN